MQKIAKKYKNHHQICHKTPRIDLPQFPHTHSRHQAQSSKKQNRKTIRKPILLITCHVTANKETHNENLLFHSSISNGIIKHVWYHYFLLNLQSTNSNYSRQMYQICCVYVSWVGCTIIEFQKCEIQENSLIFLG